MQNNDDSSRFLTPKHESGIKGSGERFIPGAFSKEVEFEHYHRYLFACNYCRGKKVLDIASGEGYGSFILSQAASQVIGIDIDAGAVSEAGARYPGVEFKTGDCRCIPLSNNSVDVVVSFETIEHVSKQEVFLAEVKRVLRPGGLLVISSPEREAYNADREQPNEFHVNELTLAEFESLLGKFFGHVRMAMQKAFAGSIVAPLEGKPGGAEFFELTASDIRRGGQIQGSYCVAVASDEPVAKLPQSVYSGTASRNFLSSLAGGIEERDRIIAGNRTEMEALRKAGLSMQEQVIDQIGALQTSLSETAAVQERLRTLLSEAQSSRDRILSRLTHLEHSMGLLLRSTVSKRSGGLAFMDLARFIQAPRRFMRQKKEAGIIAKSGLFDSAYYLDAYRDVLMAALDPLDHFVRRGCKEGRKPNPFFDCTYYLTKYPDVRAAGINPLAHYVANGEAEGRRSSPFFDPKYYLSAYPDVKTSGMPPLLHYLRCGRYEGRRAVSGGGEALCGKQASGELFSSSFSGPSGWCDGGEDLLLKEFGSAHDLFDVYSVPGEKARYDKIRFSVGAAPLISIIIPVHNQWPYTYNCLSSLRALKDKSSFEIIIADDESTDRTADIGSCVEGIRVIKNPGTRGFVENCNNAAKAARGRYLFFLNNDTAVWNGALDALCSVLETYPQAGIAGAKLVYPDLTLQEAGGIVWRDASCWNFGRGDNPGKPEYMYLKEVDYVSGAALMVKKSLWDEIGGFDKRYAPAYFEDTDLAFEARERGSEVFFQPAAVVTHFEGVSNGTSTGGGGLKAYQAVNEKKFRKKWHARLNLQQSFEGGETFFARDRSKGKKTILFIDHMLMTFDRDAGSRNQFTYLKLACEKGMNVKFLGMNFARMQPYARIFEQLGVECLLGNEMAQGGWIGWLERNGAYLDYIFINRACVAGQVIEAAKKASKAKILYNVCDLRFLRLKEECRLRRSLRCLIAAVKSERKELRLANCMDVIYCVSLEETALLRQRLPHKEIVWMPIYAYSEEELRACESWAKPYAERKDIMFVGGFNHPPNPDAVEWFVKEIFPAIKAQWPAVKFHVAGSNPPPHIAALQSDDVLIHGALPDEELAALYGSCRVVVIPLRFGAGLKGKTLEAIAYGTPFVGTRFALQGYPEKEKIFKAYDDSQAFAAEVMRLYSDKNAWRAETASYKEYVSKYFSKARALECLEEGLGGGAPSVKAACGTEA